MTEHVPGDWYGVASSAGIALVPPSVPLEAVRQIWLDLRQGRGIGAVIDGLVGAFGTSLSQLPHFAVLYLEADGGVRIALRGPVEARLWQAEDAEPSVLSGLGVTTWNERTRAEGVRGELLIPGTAAGESLPVVDGIVKAGRLSLVFNEVIRPAEEIAPVPAADRDEILAPTPAEEVKRGLVAETVVEPELVVAELAEAAEAAEPAEAVEAESVESVEEGTVGELADEFASLEELLADSVKPEVSRGAETMLPEAVPTEYDQLLFGETVMSSVESAAVRPQGDGEVEAAAAPSGLISAVPLAGLAAPAAEASWDDHDGETVMVEELLALADQQVAIPASAEPPTRVVVNMLLPQRAPIVLDRSAIIGTRPKLSRVQGGNVPHLVSVESPNLEISRSHAEVRVEGASVLAVDLDSTNGTMLLRVGAEPLRLQPREAYLLVGGDQLDLGDGVIISFEGLA